MVDSCSFNAERGVSEEKEPVKRVRAESSVCALFVTLGVRRTGRFGRREAGGFACPYSGGRVVSPAGLAGFSGKKARDSLCENSLGGNFTLIAEPSAAEEVGET